MKWKGETESQWEDRTMEWHRIFCIVPRQMRNGNWLWLEACWTKRTRTMRGGWYWEFSDSLTAPEDVRPARPAPPASMRSGGRRGNHA